MNADVSIVVRTKDRPDFLRRAVASITGQTHEQWECVVVNDGGDSKPIDTLLGTLPDAIRERFHVIHHETARGRWQSANAGVLAATAPLLVLHDDDDSWHPDFLSAAVAYLANHPERDGVVSRTEIVWERRAGAGFEIERREVFQPHLRDLLLSDALLFNRYVPIGFVYRRTLHQSLGLYDESLPVVGDWAFNLRLLARGPLEYLGETPLAYWHQRVDASGIDGNSVIEASGDHTRYDAIIRDRALREHVAEHGLGALLYLTKFIDQRFVDVENGIRTEMRESPVNRIAERLRAAGARLRRGRR